VMNRSLPPLIFTPMRTNRHKSDQKEPAASVPAGTSKLTERHQAAKDWFTETGTSVAQWASERNFNVRLVHHVLNGRTARRGASHQIAVALGIKDAVTADVVAYVKGKRGARK
jgi:gp16 family phage-associated protein